MSTKKALKPSVNPGRYRVVGDNDGHDYIIKTDQEDDFCKWVEAMEEGEETDLDFEGNRVKNSGWTFTDPQGY